MYIYIYVYITCVYIYIWCRVAGPPPPPPMVCPRPSQASRVIRITVDVCPPPQARPLALANGGGGLTHNAWNRKTESDRSGVGKDNPMRMMAMMLCTLTLMCYFQCGCWWYPCSYVALGFGTDYSSLSLALEGTSEFSGTASHPQVQTRSNRTPNQR